MIHTTPLCPPRLRRPACQASSLLGLLLAAASLLPLWPAPLLAAPQAPAPRASLPPLWPAPRLAAPQGPAPRAVPLLHRVPAAAERSTNEPPGRLARVAAIASDDQTLALDIASAWMANQPAQSMPWEWQQAVLMEGIQAVHRATGDEQLLRYLEDWIDFYLYRGYHIHSSDTLVPCTSAQYLYHVTGDPNYLSPINDGRDYLEQIAPRLEDGAIAHTRVLTHQIWEDSLFMFGTFLTLDASLLGRAEAFDELAEQFDLFADHLLSSSAGLYYHMYDETVDKTMPETPTFWGRGNGWVIASLAMMLTVLPEDHPDRAALEAQFRIHAEALMKWQDPSGLWWTVLDQPGRKDNYLETSASALNTFGLLRGYNLGLLDDRALIAAQNGLVGIRSRIDYDATGRPVVTGISGATNPGPYAYYVRIRTDDDLPYGVGAVLMALQEAAR